MSVTRIANRDAKKFVTNRTAFVGSNLYSEQPSPNVYVVYSYGPHFPLFAYLHGQWYGNSDSYSPSTKRHQYYARPDAHINMVDTSSLKSLIEESEQHDQTTA